MQRSAMGAQTEKYEGPFHDGRVDEEVQGLMKKSKDLEAAAKNCAAQLEDAQGSAMSIRNVFIASLLGIFWYTSAAFANSCSNVDVSTNGASCKSIMLPHACRYGNWRSAPR